MKNLTIKILQDYLMYVVLLVLIIFFSVTTKNFLSIQNLLNIVNANAYLIIVGVGVTFIMLGGAMDLSIGYIMSTTAVVLGVMAKNGIPTPVLLLTGIVLAVALSTFNGVMYAWLQVFPFIITLATQYVLYGATFLISDSKTFKDFDDAFRFMGKGSISIGGVRFYISIIVMILALALGAFILNKTYLGRNVYALGSNPDAVALSGVSVAKMRIIVFAIAGFFFGLGTIVVIGRLGSASYSTGAAAAPEFVVMAGAMLGGVKMGGGGGKVSDMFVGMIIIGLMNNGMDLAGINSFWQKIALGAILLLAIILDTLQTRRVVNNAKKVAGTAPADE